jgi:hypothetical protein
VSSASSNALRLPSSSDEFHHSGRSRAISAGNCPLKIALRAYGVAVGRIE